MNILTLEFKYRGIFGTRYDFLIKCSRVVTVIRELFLPRVTLLTSIYIITADFYSPRKHNTSNCKVSRPAASRLRRRFSNNQRSRVNI